MKPLSASEYDRRREFQVAGYIRLLSSPEKIPAPWWLLPSSAPGRRRAGSARSWRTISWGERWRWMRTTG
jgi:hypothetical protein